MSTNQYNAQEWLDLVKYMNVRQLRNSLKRAYRTEAKKILNIARKHLDVSGMHVQGNKSEWKKGIRSRIYSRGGGFMLTVKSRASTMKGGGEKSMHLNRRGVKKPILMWAEEGTDRRYSRSKSKNKKRTYHGRMPAYGFLEKAEPEMYSTVEADLVVDVSSAVEAVAKKCGFV